VRASSNGRRSDDTQAHRDLVGNRERSRQAGGFDATEICEVLGTAGERPAV